MGMPLAMIALVACGVGCGSDDSESDSSSLPFKESFESGSLAACWSVNSTATGQAVPATTDMPHTGSYHFIMDSSGASYSLNELVLTIDLEGLSDVTLGFFCRAFND
jgi:hypothetical protein